MRLSTSSAAKLKSCQRPDSGTCARAGAHTSSHPANTSDIDISRISFSPQAQAENWINCLYQYRPGWRGTQADYARRARGVRNQGKGNGAARAGGADAALISSIGAGDQALLTTDRRGSSPPKRCLTAAAMPAPSRPRLASSLAWSPWSMNLSGRPSISSGLTKRILATVASSDAAAATLGATIEPKARIAIFRPWRLISPLPISMASSDAETAAPMPEPRG